MKHCFIIAGVLLLGTIAVRPAQSVEESAQIRCSGSVVDAAGKPIEGATVELYQFEGGFPVGAAEIKADQTLTTKVDGSFEFRARPMGTVLFACKPGLAPAWANAWRPQGDIEEQLVLKPPGSVSGVVLDDAEKPVPDAEVWLELAYAETDLGSGSRSYHYLPRFPHRDLFSARSGADGKFQISNCPTNASLDLGARKSGRFLRDAKREYISPETLRWRPGQQELKLVLEEAGSAEGKIRVQESGEPAAGVRVFFEPQTSRPTGRVQPQPVSSDAQGNFKTTELAPGAYRVRAIFGTNQMPLLVAEVLEINVAAGRATRGLEISGTKGGFLEVTVREKDANPLPQISVSIVSPRYWDGRPTSSNGTALFRLPPGDYTASAYWENSRSGPASVTVETGATNRVALEIAPPSKITGVARDTRGEPVAGLDLRIMPEYRQPGVIKTDKEGRFSFPWNASASSGLDLKCSLVARDLKRNLALAVDLEEGTKRLDLRLQPGFSVTGRIEDMEGKALTNGTVQLYFWSGNSSSPLDTKPIRVDAQGRFEIKTLPAGRRYQLSGTARGYGSETQEIRNEESETSQLELSSFQLAVADHKLAGQVVDADDKPVENAGVHLYGKGQPNAYVRTDQKGFFTINEVCAGDVNLSASIQGAHGNIRAEADDTNIVLKLGSNTASSIRQAPRRVSLKGKPLPELAAAGLANDCAPTGKPVLLCLFDCEQRPCRRFVKQLAEQHDALRQKGITLIGLQAAIIGAEPFKEWKESDTLPFSIGQVLEKNEKTKWAVDAEPLPWLILADKEHRVITEGFALDELKDLIKEHRVSAEGSALEELDALIKEPGKK